MYGHEAIIIADGNSIIINVMMDDIIYMIQSSTVNVNELIKMAESLRL